MSEIIAGAKIISKWFPRFIAAHEYFSLSLKSFFSGWDNFEIISRVVTCERKPWNYSKIVAKWFHFTCNHSLTHTSGVS